MATLRDKYQAFLNRLPGAQMRHVICAQVNFAFFDDDFVWQDRQYNLPILYTPTQYDAFLEALNVEASKSNFDVGIIWFLDNSWATYSHTYADWIHYEMPVIPKTLKANIIEWEDMDE
jgi:hypothetical protein